MSFHARPISFKPPRLKGLSARLIASHYENNYGGTVRRLNAIKGELASFDPASAPGFRLNGLKREELIATNSMLLHEIYFDGLGEGGGGDPTGALADAIARDFGSLAKWRAEFTAMGKALGGGSGWVLLTRSPPRGDSDGTLSNVWAADHTHGLAGGTPLLALDMYEHSYHLDFGANVGAYVDAFMANIAWARVAARFEGAPPEKKPHTVTTPDARKMLEADPDLIVIDARLADDATSVPVRLRGARRAPPDKVDEIAASLPRGAKALVYCAWGFEIGGNCAAKLRERGIDAVAVAGGIGAWRADGLPTEPHKEGETK
ncbi:MAG: superoxide dismutase [Reyranella sp.]|uniref:Fe-Mn family superoxide dismutase n=1 Tax=Reyranella sp. TaxID=1929291 RepID=UPI0011F82D12|nr:Fe-Mn family superoxide dismutase [Reyranella sp.]TAJ36365.1 MAG: superoxide dismutase [Reyranella sp.]